jgi:hypothetical protein
MSTINWFSKPTHSGSPTRFDFGSAWVRVADTIRAMFWRGGRSKDLAWCALNEHLLHDIGETRASAEYELLRSRPWNAPLGTLGGYGQAGGRPVFRGSDSA